MEVKDIQALLRMLVCNKTLEERFEWAAESVAMIRASDLRHIRDHSRSNKFRAALTSIIEGDFSEEVKSADAILAIAELVILEDGKLWKTVVNRYKRLKRKAQEGAAKAVDKELK